MRIRKRVYPPACYSLPPCMRPLAALCLPGFNRFVTSTIAGIATRLGRPLPGQDLHLLDHRTFTAHVEHYRRKHLPDQPIGLPEVRDSRLGILRYSRNP